MMSCFSVLNEYRKHHLPGTDCRLTAARNCLDYLGYKENNASIFGLSSCFGFTYQKGEFSRLSDFALPSDDFSKYLNPVLGIRADVFENLAYVLGCTLIGERSAIPQSTHATMRELLKERIPVIVAISPQALSKVTGAQFPSPEYAGLLKIGTEWTVLAELDEGRNTATLLTAMSFSPVQMTIDDFHSARSDGQGDADVVMQARGRWAAFLPTAKLPRREDMLACALTKAIVNMRDESSENNHYRGLNAIKTLAEELPEWKVSGQFSAARLKCTAWMMHVQSEVISGGGFGRRTYSAFLRQAGDNIKQDALLKVAEIYSNASNLWRQVVHAAVEAADKDERPDFSSRADLRAWMTAVVEEEQSGIDALAACVSLG